MSETLNVNVLVAAKEEYTKQLVYILSPEIYTVILNVYSDSQLLKKKRNISLKNFQIQLKKIPLWNTIIVEKNTNNIKSKIPYLLDLITAIFVSHVKILACVRLKSDSKSIQVKVPDLDNFLHKIIITNAEKIYYNPEIILKKKEIVVALISETIEETIRNQIPIDKILTEYLSGVFDEDNEKNNESKSRNNDTNNSNDSTDNETDDEKKLDEELDEELDDEFGNDSDNESEFDEEENERKNIVPTRPLPKLNLDELQENEENEESEMNGINQENRTHRNYENNQIDNSTKPKNRVLFSDAIEKSVKQNNSPEDGEESDELEFDDESDDQ